MPAAEAALAERSEHPGLGVGVHLNACQGPALSRQGRAVLAGPAGLMNATGAALVRRCALRPRRTLVAVEAEFDAQIAWCLSRGLRPTHLDSHRHVHAWPAIFRLVAGLCGRYDIAFVRWHREACPAGGGSAPAKQRVVSRLLNLLGRRCRKIAPGRIATAGTLGVAHTGRIDVPFLLAAIDELPAAATEIMTHPGYGDDLDPAQTRLLAGRRAETDALCDELVRQQIAARNVALVHYGQLA